MFPAASAPPMLFTLVLLNGLSAAALNMFLPSLSNIAADFQAGYGLLASASIAGYAGMTTLLQLLIGPLSDRVGRRPVILVSLAIFVLASLGCLLARDVWTFCSFARCRPRIISGFVQSRVAAPLVATTVFQMSPAALGFYLGSTAAGFILGSFVSGQFAARYRLPTMVVAGRMVAFVGLTVGLGLLLAGIVHEGCQERSQARGALTAGITGMILREANAAFVLLGMMLLSSTMALLAALFVLWLDRRESEGNPA